MIEPELQALRPLMDGIGFGTATAADYEELPLHPEEAQSVDGMLPKRRRDFWMGRSAAHRALADLGAADGPVVMNQRRPVFPHGLTGSLSHSGGVAVAIVASATQVRSLGIDLELDPLPPSAAALVLGPEEIHWAAEGRCTCAEAFSAKEAAYKALLPLLDCGAPPLRQILLDPVEGGFKARLAKCPHIQAFVSIRHVATGILAWTAVL